MMTQNRTFLSDTTNSSFLLRVRNGNEEAWHDFYRKYAGMIYETGQKRHLNAEECDDLMIEVMTIFWQKMDRFVYQPQRGRLRNYLKKIANFCAKKRFADQQKHDQFVTEQETEYPPDVDSVYLDEWRDFLLKQALEELKSCVDVVTFQVFYMSYFQQRSVKDICAITRQTANNVYVIRSRCLARMQALIAQYRQLSEMELLRLSHKNRDEH